MTIILGLYLNLFKLVKHLPGTVTHTSIYPMGCQFYITHMAGNTCHNEK